MCSEALAMTPEMGGSGAGRRAGLLPHALHAIGGPGLAYGCHAAGLLSLRGRKCRCGGHRAGAGALFGGWRSSSACLGLRLGCRLTGVAESGDEGGHVPPANGTGSAGPGLALTASGLGEIVSELVVLAAGAGGGRGQPRGCDRLAAGRRLWLGWLVAAGWADDRAQAAAVRVGPAGLADAVRLPRDPFGWWLGYGVFAAHRAVHLVAVAHAAPPFR